MLKIVFTHDRPDMLQNLLKEIGLEDTVVLDKHPAWDGKRKFWIKWREAVKLALESNHDWFLFLADDFSNINMNAINQLATSIWDNHLVAINILNDGRTHCWGMHSTGQPEFDAYGITLKEVGFVDCGYLTNRHTLKNLKIEDVGQWWFDRPDKSSGVGFQTTKQFRQLGVKMMMPTPSLADHGKHESVMHGDHRKETPLVAKR
jgi:hypothetical protein